MSATTPAHPPTAADAPAPARPDLRRGARVLLVWLAALLVTVALAPLLERSVFVFFWVAVLYAAWHAGFLAALLVATSAVWACDRIFTGASVLGLDGLLSLGIFLLAAGLVSRLAAREGEARAGLVEAERAVRRANRELEERNQLLADQQVELESQVEEAQAMAMELEAAVEQQEHAMAEADLARSGPVTCSPA